MNLYKKAAIAGVYEHPTRWAPDKSSFQIHAESARGALEDAGLKISDVDAYFTSGVSGMAPILMAEHLNLNPKYLDSTSIGGSSFDAHVNHACAAVAAGLCEVALITYGSTASSAGMAIGTGLRLGGEPPEQFEAPYGPTTVGAYGLVAHRHMHQYGTTSEQLAEIAVTMRRHASMNPLAKYRDPITVDDVLESRIISSPLHLLDCCIISDGGGAVVVTTPERAKDLKKPPIWVLGAGESCVHTGMGMRDITEIAACRSGETAFAMADVTHSDIDMAMIYDSFTITVLTTLENLGFCEKGEGGEFVLNGRIGLGGELPINPEGGGLSNNHPGMRGIFLVIEATKQLRGECGNRQVEDAALALVHGTGGWLGIRHSGVTLILSNR
jgi:acetyl-CoA C-acetyltransferase